MRFCAPQPPCAPVPAESCCILALLHCHTVALAGNRRNSGAQGLSCATSGSDVPFDSCRYLFKSTSAGVQDYLCNRLYALPEAGVERYLLQLGQLVLTRPHSSLERVLIDLCARSLRLAVKVHTS
jgi:hypothetical protein